MNTSFRKSTSPALRRSAFAVLLLSATMLGGCASAPKPPQISYDSDVPALPTVPTVVADDRPRPLHTPPAWTPAKGGTDAKTPVARVENANAAARIEPRREGYYNAIQIYPWSEGALYQVYAAPGQITNIALEPGESLTGAGPIAAGDTARWIIGDTESGEGANRRSYMIELRAGEKPYMPAVAWAYPQVPGTQRPSAPPTPLIPSFTARNYRYALSGDTPSWRPMAVYDDGRKVYVEFPRGIVQGEMPPLFVIGADGEAQIVNSRIHQNILIVDRLFGAAELRIGDGERPQKVRIERTDVRPAS